MKNLNFIPRSLALMSIATLSMTACKKDSVVPNTKQYYNECLGMYPQAFFVYLCVNNEKHYD